MASRSQGKTYLSHDSTHVNRT